MLSLSNLITQRDAGNEKLRYGHARASKSGTRAPRPVVVWAITRACNLRCVHCYASAGIHPDNNELTHEEGKDLLSDLKSYGVPAVLFSGGEPLMRPDALPLLQHARDLGLRCTLSTNGTMITRRVADALQDIGLQYIGISLDGIGSNHDLLRGVRGCFDRSLRAIQRCRARGIKVGVRFTAHAGNINELDRVYELCLEQGVDRLCVYHLATAGRGASAGLNLTADQTRRMLDKLMQRAENARSQGHDLELLTVGNHADAVYLLLKMDEREPERAAQVFDQLKGNGGNGSGCHIASIDPVGNVHYDQFSWHYTCGNVRTQTFSEVWADAHDPRLRQLRRRRPALPSKCQQCAHLNLCNGNLRTRAESATGDWLGEDPLCYLTEQEQHLSLPVLT